MQVSQIGSTKWSPSRKPLAKPKGGKSWLRHPTRMEVAGLDHNVFGGFISLKIGIFAADQGSVRLTDFSYKALS